jgi:hypothetical protein
MRNSASQRSYQYIIAIHIKKYLYCESVISGIYVWAIFCKLQKYLKKFHLTTQKKFWSDRFLCTFKRNLKIPVTWCSLLLHLQQIYVSIHTHTNIYTHKHPHTHTHTHTHTQCTFTWNLPTLSQAEFIETYPADLTLYIWFYE